MKTIKLIFFYLSTSVAVLGQNDIPVGTWRTHTSYHEVIDISSTGNTIYSATANALFVYDQEDGSLRTITKLDGLSGGEISAIAYASITESLVIGYHDGNIDIIKDNTIFNIPTIKNDNFAINKRINSIYIEERQAYLIADFGISILDLERLLIGETAVDLGPDRFFEAATFNDSIFVATSGGIISASLDPSVNFLDFNNWKLSSHPATAVVSLVKSNEELYAVEEVGDLYHYRDGTWSPEPVLSGASFVNISPSSGGIFIITSTDIWKYENAVLSAIERTNISPNEILQGQNGIIWIADQKRGLIQNTSDGQTQSIIPSGPFSNHSYSASFLGGKLLVVSGGIAGDDTALDRSDGFYSFDNGLWTSYNSTGVTVSIPDTRDLVNMTYNPAKKQEVFASFQDGLLLVDEDNSSEVVNALSPGSTLADGVISDVAYGNEGVWVLNYGQSQPVHHWSDDGSWEAYRLNNTAAQYPLELLIAQNNDKWLRLSPDKGGGLFVFNEDSGKQRLLNNITNNGDLPSSSVYAIAEDQDGLIWVGTGNGVAYFRSSAAIEEDNAVNAITPRVNVVPLLRGEKILSLAVDPGNRKWVGTENGAWLFGESGEIEISHFNTQNSPLPSNRILSIAINGNTGEVFFCTDQGLVSYRGTATEARATHQKVKIFPNPVTQKFNGLVSISGLANNAVVKITDSSGKLIRQMQASGGTATWNVRDYRGNRASTGVYLVFSSTVDGSDTFVGKLAIVN